eukprot:gene40999-55409_t
MQLILAAALLGMLLLNWPGHMSVDSVLALHEGRFQVRETWNPAIFGWLLGILDSLRPGGSLMTILNGVLLFGSWIALPALRPRTSWLAPALALGVVALPQVLIYPGIVWKDVLFAVVTLSGFVTLAFGVRKPSPVTPWITLACTALLFAVAGLLRQNGLQHALQGGTGQLHRGRVAAQQGGFQGVKLHLQRADPGVGSRCGGHGAALGRSRPPGGLIVVGTQTLEQSLDIDADLLVTDIKTLLKCLR